ncbi:MAG: hypothetical protein MUE35_11190 [Hydrogenophaga sp.]|nr:hypothetical protein [Hydrogenophaga sp.]
MRRMQVVHIHRDAPAQPAWGEPCNGCGVCCLAEPCPLGRWISGRRTGACDALRWDAAQARYRCGAVTDAASVLGPRWAWAAPLWRRLARRWIAAGVGCDARLTTERVEAP